MSRFLTLALGLAVTLAGVCPPALAEDDDGDLLDRPRHVTARSDQAVERAGLWLSRHQHRDGSFREGGGMGAYPAAMTALAGMAFLCHGDTPSRGRYSANVRRAVQFLTDRRQVQQGDPSPAPGEQRTEQHEQNERQVE